MTTASGRWILGGLAAVGVGGMGQHYLAGCKGERVVALCDLVAARMEDFARELPEPVKFFTDFEAMAADPEVDAVFVLTNLETHLEYAKAAFAVGKPVLCEKPVAASADEVREMKRCADEAGLLVWHDCIFACAQYPASDPTTPTLRYSIGRARKRALGGVVASPE